MEGRKITHYRTAMLTFVLTITETGEIKSGAEEYGRL